MTCQDPEKIAVAVRLFSDKELWNEVAVQLGATPATKTAAAKSIRKELSLIVQRRNKIAHEGDLQPNLPRVPWPINTADLSFVSNRIETIVKSIDSAL
jgi:hypothetical protein